MDARTDFFVTENVELADFTTWKIGGRARYFCNANAANAPAVVAWARERKIPFCILGGGSNVLIPSGGIDGLVVRFSPKGSEIVFDEGFIRADASAPLGRLVSFSESEGIAGFEFLAGIPGSVGGAVFMNAGIAGDNKCEICDIFESAKILKRDGHFETVNLYGMNFAYRKSIIQESEDIILSAKFKILKKCGSAEITKRIKTKLSERKLREPENKRTAGSVFKAANGIPAAVFIEKAGLKGFKTGAASVSRKHANWIENIDNASSDDVLELIRIIKEVVLNRFSVCLETEVRLLEAKH